MYAHYTSTYKHAIENENKKNKLVSQYVKGLFLHEHLQWNNLQAALVLYNLSFLLIDKNEATIRVVGKKNMSLIFYV